MKRLWVAAALAPLSFAAMAAVDRAHADTTVSTSTTTPLSTSSAGNVTVSGSIAPSPSPAAITVDSNASVTITSSGTVSYTAVSGNATIPVSDILIEAGSTTSAGAATNLISNSGSIDNTESTSGDGTNQSITNGPFANGAYRDGIDVTGPGVFYGSISNTGTITVIGENSAGIAIGTEMTGNLTQTGDITVTGGTPTYGGTPAGTINGNTTVTNAGNVSYGIDATGKIDGNVTIGAIVGATGQNAVGVALSGGVGGGVTIDGSITATGYRSTTAPTDPTVLANLTADQTLQGGPALEIGGNVGSGVTLAAAVAASGNVSAVPAGVLTVYGSAPALMIGGANAIDVGANAAGFSLEVAGSVYAYGAYPDVSAVAIQIGGVNPLPVASSGVASGGDFGNVTLGGGIDVTGTVLAATESHTAGQGDATAILIGNGNASSTTSGVYSVSTLVNSGTIAASASSNAVISASAPGNEVSVADPTKSVPITVSAIKVGPGGSLTSINNSGTISAAIGGIPAAVNFTAAGGIQGQAIAIDDLSGTVTSVTNTNTIAASVTPIVSGQTADPAHSDAVAIYLANVGGDVSVTQSANGNTSIIPTITGAVIFGNSTVATASPGSIIGAERLDLEAGNMTGALVYNGAGDNSLTINGGATLIGALSQSASGALTLDILDGTLDMTAPTSNTLGGPTATINAPNLTIGATGVVIFSIDPRQANAAAAQFNVAGNATIDSGAKIGVNLMSKLTTTETFTLIHAGALSVGGIDTSLLGQLPFLYQGLISNTATDLDIQISLKSAAAMGLNPAQAAAYGAIFTQMSTDVPVESDVLSQTTRSGFLHIYNQFLPDYAGGPFEAIANGQRALARAEAEAPVKLQTNQTRGWVQEIGFLANRDNSSATTGYQAEGFGLAGGIEHARGDSAIGVTAAFLTNAVNNSTQTSDGTLSTIAIEGGVYWRAGGEGLNANASVNGGYVSLGSHRLLLDQTAAGAVTLLRDAKSQWSGAVGSAQFGVSYQITHGRFYMRPEASVDYVALYETAHSEQGGGSALNLGINSRLGSEASAQGDLVLGWGFGDALRWRPELTVGWRQIIYGGPASTTARFLSGGSSFTLTPDLTDRGGLLARLGIRASGSFADITADAGGEFRNGYQTYDARAVARFLF